MSSNVLVDITGAGYQHGGVSVNLSNYITKQVAKTQFVDASGDSMTNDLNMLNNRIIGVKNPIDSQDVVNKQYVDSIDATNKTYVNDELNKLKLIVNENKFKILKGTVLAKGRFDKPTDCGIIISEMWHKPNSDYWAIMEYSSFVVRDNIFAIPIYADRLNWDFIIAYIPYVFPSELLAASNKVEVSEASAKLLKLIP